jgi:hypothetical protein
MSSQLNNHQRPIAKLAQNCLLQLPLLLLSPHISLNVTDDKDDCDDISDIKQHYGFV